jgi:hypothetical protein
MPAHDEASLPKWAQQRLAALRTVVDDRDAELKTLRQAHALLTEGARSWFTLPGPSAPDEKPIHLWLLNHDHPFPVCDLGKGDVLLVGRATRPSTPPA